MFIFCLETACKFLKDQYYTGRDNFAKVKPNPPTNIVCAEKCKTRREKNPSINGIAWFVHSKECWCMIGMRGKKSYPGYDICYFGESLLVCVDSRKR